MCPRMLKRTQRCWGHRGKDGHHWDAARKTGSPCGKEVKWVLLHSPQSSPSKYESLDNRARQCLEGGRGRKSREEGGGKLTELTSRRASLEVRKR